MITTQVLPVERIMQLFSRAYVVLDTCRFDDEGRVTHGRVLCSTPDREEAYEALRQHPNSMILFAGPSDDEADGAYLDGGRVWEAVT